MNWTDNIDALVCGLPAHERARRKLLMLTAFFDDSGTDGSGPFCVIAGYISDVERWKAFSDAWAGELQADPRISHLKMTEANNRRGPFWGWDIVARDRKIERLAEIISQYAIGGLASIVSHKAYLREAKGFLPDTIDNPYWLCFQRVILESARIYGHECAGGKINFVFDTQGEGYERRAALIHSGWEKAQSTAYQPLVGSITFASDLDILPLQAADLLAWHIRRRSDRHIQKAPPENRPVDDVLGKLPIPLLGWTAQEIADFVADYQRFHPESPINRPDLH